MILIDIERFKKEIADYTNESGYVDIPLLFLLNTLSAVADGIVECKDCKYYLDDGWGYGNCGRPNVDFLRMRERDFCSYGDRKEVENETDNK